MMAQKTGPKSVQARETGHHIDLEETKRAMVDILQWMPLLSVDAQGRIDYPASDASLLVGLADRAETAQRTIILGIAAIGDMMVCASPEIEDGSIHANTVEALGWLLAEMGEFSARLFVMAAHCRHAASTTAPS